MRVYFPVSFFVQVCYLSFTRSDTNGRSRSQVPNCHVYNYWL